MRELLTAFLKDLARWRKFLRNWLAESEVGLDATQLDRTVQDIIDRAICLHLCASCKIAACWHCLILQPIHGSPTMILDRWVQATLQRLESFMQTCEINALPIALLGYSYEQFLSMNQTSNRKAQGAYYTPPDVVDYLIKHTLVPCLAKQRVTCLDFDLSQALRILDPACGGGAFLLRAYQYLLDWYQTQGNDNPDMHRSQFYQTYGGEWRLTLAAKQSILLNHIYGVDCDPTAVKLTQRSLLLQLLEGSAEEATIHLAQANWTVNSLRLDVTRLDKQICCGDALVGSDFYAQEPVDFNADDRIKPLDWEQAFPNAMKSGGFDVVIGNPPWLFTRTAKFDDRLKHYYQRHYFARSSLTETSRAKQTGKINLFTVFLFKFIELLHPNGRIGIVVPNTLLRTTVYEQARKYILDQCHIEQIVELGHDSISAITASVTLLILGKNATCSTLMVAQSIAPNAPIRILNKHLFLNNTSYVFSLSSSQQYQIFEKIMSTSARLSTLTQEIIEGIVCRKDQISTHPFTDRHQRLLEGKDVSRYAIAFRNKYLLFDRSQLHRPRPNYVWDSHEKIILRRIGGGTRALTGVLDTEYYYTFASTNNILLKADCPYDIRYVLALLNSQLLNDFYIQKFTNQSRLTVNIAKTFLEQLPIRSLNLNCSTDKQKHDRLVQAVDHMQSLHCQFKLAASPDEQHRLQQQIDTIDQQIDRWVYDLYELTETEIQRLKTPAAC
ncbi:Eco57I restriction-modification methylase domain-containing protein [Thermocoleostomius sinensis]|uniref:site-specific DNA-methyltransferase (adenine-specific) n=1 Tax=Thermocoleostomius sinensis A174 TaxID=2016057 RepID=A0A9E8ZD91_9CYAN|nr:N-6 DNA methylase [Thermocoleostomius sinensis]WAL60696.1 N-6 DNA methylase [Thermocoleostomius sinensis A174]